MTDKTKQDNNYRLMRLLANCLPPKNLKTLRVSDCSGQLLTLNPDDDVDLTF